MAGSRLRYDCKEWRHELWYNNCLTLCILCWPKYRATYFVVLFILRAINCWHGKNCFSYIWRTRRYLRRYYPSSKLKQNAKYLFEWRIILFYNMSSPGDVGQELDLLLPSSYTLLITSELQSILFCHKIVCLVTSFWWQFWCK